MSIATKVQGLITASTFFGDMTPMEQQMYLKMHPNSKYKGGGGVHHDAENRHRSEFMKHSNAAHNATKMNDEVEHLKSADAALRKHKLLLKNHKMSVPDEDKAAHKEAVDRHERKKRFYGIK